MGRYDGARRNELYVVTRTEPQAKGSRVLPWIEETGEGPGEEAPREDPSLLGSVDDPPEASLVRGELLVRGWARMPGEGLSVTLVLDGEARSASSFKRAPRPDVCKVFPKLAPCAAAGYEARFDSRPATRGRLARRRLPHEGRAGAALRGSEVHVETVKGQPCRRRSPRESANPLVKAEW